MIPITNFTDFKVRKSFENVDEAKPSNWNLAEACLITDINTLYGQELKRAGGNTSLLIPNDTQFSKEKTVCLYEERAEMQERIQKEIDSTKKAVVSTGDNNVKGGISPADN